jgi:hypothetical protein
VGEIKRVTWTKLNPKIAWAAGTMLAADLAPVIAWLNDSTTWKQTVAAILLIDVPVLVGYLKPDTSK